MRGSGLTRGRYALARTLAARGMLRRPFGCFLRRHSWECVRVGDRGASGRLSDDQMRGHLHDNALFQKVLRCPDAQCVFRQTRWRPECVAPTNTRSLRPLFWEETTGRVPVSLAVRPPRRLYDSQLWGEAAGGAVLEGSVRSWGHGAVVHPASVRACGSCVFLDCVG